MTDDTKKPEDDDFEFETLEDEDFGLEDDDSSLDDISLDDDILGDDDFEDLADLVDEDWEDLEDDTTAQAPIDAKNSGAGQGSNKLVVYGLVGVFVAIVLFVGGSKIMGLLSSDEPVGKPGAVQSTSLNPPQEEQVADVGIEPVSDAPPMPSAVVNADDIQSPDPVSGQVAQEAEPLTPLPNFSAQDEEAIELPPLEVATNEFAPTAMPQVSEEQPVVPVADIEKQDVMPEPVMDSAPSASYSSDAAFDTKELDDLISRLDKFEGRLSGNEESLARITDILERLETQLSKVSGDVDKAMKLASAKSLSSSASAPVKAKSVSAPKAVEPKKTAKAPKSTPKPVLYDSKPKANVASKINQDWVLKSAQPDRAVVAESKTNYLRSVEVGTSLEGIGKVTSISNASGRWVVQGTQGRIVQ